MAVPRDQAAYDPSGYRRWTNSLTPSGTDSGAGSPPAPRVHDVNGMTAASAARAYERLLGVRNMTGRANDDVQSAQPINGLGPMKVDFIDGPLPSQPPPTGANDHQSKLAAEQEKRQQAQEREQQKPSAPAVDQPPAEVPGSQTPPPIATQPQGSPAPTVPVEEHDPLLDAKGPNQDALPMPSTDGREVGKTWTEVRPNGQVVEYTIPEGNGKNTVDAVVKDAAGNVLSTARIVSIEGTANYIRWQDDVGGGSSYFESGGPNGLGYGQHFAPGTSTSGIPTHAFETSPDASKSRTLSLDSAGRVVGVDIGVRNSQGLYDNIHVDNFGNATMSSTKLGPGGELQSKFTGQMFANRSGWMIDEFDNHWEGEPDKDGNQSWFRVQNGHTYRMNHLGVITDFSLDKDGRPRLDTIFPDGSQTVQSGRTTVHFDASGKEAWRNEIPAPVQPWDVRAWEGTKRGLTGLASVVSDTVGAPFHMMQDGVRGMSSIRVDQYGTFHVTYDAPNRFANAGTAVVGLAKGAAMFYLALPKYAVMTGYDALRGSDFVRGSTTYQPPDREGELVKDLTGIPLEQWKDNTVGTTFEFGATAVGGLILFRSVGIRPRSGFGATGLLEISSGFRRRSNSYISGSAKSALEMASGLGSRAAKYAREQVDRIRDWGDQPVRTLDVLSEVMSSWIDRLSPQAVPAEGFRGVPATEPRRPDIFASEKQSAEGSSSKGDSAPNAGARRAAAESVLGRHLGKVVDLDRWLRMHSQKADPEFAQALTELREVVRILDKDPKMGIKTALELGPDGEPPKRSVPEFDLLLLPASGARPIRVEVTTIQKELRDAADLTDGIRHGSDKVEARDGLAKPMSRPREVVIYARVGQVTWNRKGQITEFSPDGNIVFKRPTGEVIRTKNIFSDLLGNLNGTPPKPKNAGNLDRITVVDSHTGLVLTELVNVNSRWTRVADVD